MRLFLLAFVAVNIMFSPVIAEEEVNSVPPTDIKDTGTGTG